MNSGIPFELLLEHAGNACGAAMLILRQDRNNPSKLVPVYVSESSEERFGYSIEEARGGLEGWTKRIHPDDRSRAVAAGENLLSTGAVEHEYRFCHADGHYLWIRETLRVLPSVEDEPKTIVGTWIDISQQRKAQQELAKKVERYRAVIEGAADGIFTASSSGVILEVNPAGCRLLRGESDQIVGSHVTDIITRENLRDKPFQLERLQYGEMVSIERTLQRFDGSEVHVEIRANMLADGRYLGTIHDVTTQQIEKEQRAKLEGQLRQAQKLEAIGLLAGGVAHDLNNILVAVDGMTSLLKLELADDTRHATAIETILSASKRGAALTRNLLGFARKSELRMDPLSMNEVVGELQGLLNRTLDKRIIVRSRFEKKLKLVRGDSGALGHALLNLALNAADAMQGAGTMTLSTSNVHVVDSPLSATTDIEKGDYVVVRVIDDGAGMDRETLSRVFEPFFTTKHRGEGTGLGLSMVYGTAHQHDGAVGIESAPGSGTTVSLYLPALVGETVSPPAIDEQTVVPESRGEETVLVVDDEAMVVEALRSILERLGYSVLDAGDGEEALERYRKHEKEIDLVIMDIHMPVMGGREAIAELKKLDPEIPVLVISGFFQKRLVKELRARGVVNLLRKPFTLEEVAIEVRTILNDANR